MIAEEMGIYVPAGRNAFSLEWDHKYSGFRHIVNRWIYAGDSMILRGPHRLIILPAAGQKLAADLKQQLQSRSAMPAKHTICTSALAIDYGKIEQAIHDICTELWENYYCPVTSNQNRS